MRPLPLNHTATTAIYPLSLHDALPISHRFLIFRIHFHYFFKVRKSLTVYPFTLFRKFVIFLSIGFAHSKAVHLFNDGSFFGKDRSEEHTSELQSRENLVCRLLLEKKKT